MLPAPSPWHISPAERQQHDAQFAALRPFAGLLAGDAARPFFLQSNLPPALLGQIWQLADLNHDGKLSAQEFSIAMKLVKNTLAGVPPPQVLPDSLRLEATMTPVHNPYATAPPGAFSGGYGGSAAATPLRSQPPSVPGTPVRAPLPLSTASPLRQRGNWIVPPATKLRLVQLFNKLDRDRTGYLSGAHARNVMGESGLPMPSLAHIWTLSDVNKDGRLTAEEFVAAMFLIEASKDGYALPDELPPELGAHCVGYVPPRGSPSVNMNIDPDNATDIQPPQKSPPARTFDEKRRDNFDRGQAELERRREVLREEEDRVKREQQRKEREEEARRQREREEADRRAEAEREVELQRQRILDEARREEETRREAAALEARKEAEQRRLADLSKSRQKELERQKLADSERAAQLAQRSKTLGFELQALEEKANEVLLSIGVNREKVLEITKDIEGMKGSRDEKVAQIAQLQKETQQATVTSEQTAHQLLQLQSATAGSAERAARLVETHRKIEGARTRIAQKRAELAAAQERNERQRSAATDRNSILENGRQALTQKQAEYLNVAKAFTDLQLKGQAWLARRGGSVQTNGSNGTSLPAPTTNPLPAPTPDENAVTTTTSAVVKYRVAHEFRARTDDELSAQPGDLLLVFERHPAEPGWAAAQLRGRVGWFPRAFAEPIGPAPTGSTAGTPIHTVPGVSDHVTPSASLDRIPEEPRIQEIKRLAAAIASAPSVDENASSAESQPSAKPPSDGGRRASEIADAAKADGGRRASDAIAAGKSGGDSRRGSEAIVTPGTPKQNLQKQESSTTATNAPVLAVGVALFGWRARNDQDLSFAKGDRIEVIEQQEMRWKGRLANGKTGYFPKSYLKVVEAESGAAQPQPPQVLTAVPSQLTSPASGSPSSTPAHASPYNRSTCVIQVVAAAAREALPASGSAQSIASQAAVGSDYFVALYDFDAVESTDLSLRVGDRVHVLAKEGEWWTGETADGRRGMFPANYVRAAIPAATTAAAAEPVQRAKAIAAFEAGAENQMSLKVGDLVIVRVQTQTGWTEAEMADGSGRRGWVPAQYIVPADDGESTPGAAASAVAAVTADQSSSSGAGGFPVVARFDYAARRDDELSFQTGDTIDVTHAVDADWWSGRHQSTGATGLFPSCYVERK